MKAQHFCAVRALVFLALLVATPFPAFAVVGTDAMTPPADTSSMTEAMPADQPATISSAQVSEITHESAKITVMADEMVQAYLEYGTTSTYGMSTPLSPEFSDSPEFFLSGLLAGTVYHFRIIAADASGNMTITTDETFKTLSAPAPAPESSVSTTTTPSPQATTTPASSPAATSTPPVSSTTPPPAPEEPTTVTVPEKTDSVILATPRNTASSTGGGGLPTGPFRPLLLSVRAGDGKVSFQWKKLSDSSGEAKTLIIRKAGSAHVISRVDGEVMYDDSGSSFTDSAVENGKEYHYALYVQGAYGRFSTPARFKAIPRPGSPAQQAPVGQPAGGGVKPKPSNDFLRNLSVGAVGEDVTRLQQFLVDRDFYPEARVTGYFGALTKSALKRFQSASGITPVAGYFGPLSRMKAGNIMQAEFVNN